jgi:hypothetical protein
MRQKQLQALIAKCRTQKIERFEVDRGSTLGYDAGPEKKRDREIARLCFLTGRSVQHDAGDRA